MTLCADIDVYSSNRVLAVMDDNGKPVLQCLRPNDLLRLLGDDAQRFRRQVRCLLFADICR